MSRALAFLADYSTRRASSWVWPEEYVNSETGKVYMPHNNDEVEFVDNDSPTYFLLKGGEGAGKSVAGIVKTLNRLRRGMSGIMGSPDFEHLKKSLWPEFIRWCPVQCVVPSQRYRLRPTYNPGSTFNLLFYNELGTYSKLQIGGFKEDAIGGWEGPNVSFVHFDEGRRHKTSAALKVLAGRVRIPGPNGESPQLYITTTPRKHWLYEYFGPSIVNDPHADFKERARVFTVPVYLNIENLDPDYIDNRRASLTAQEARIVMDAEWEDESDTEKFVNIVWWERCQYGEPIPSLPNQPSVIALDASMGSDVSMPDSFAMVMASRAPWNTEHVLVRYVGVWQPVQGQAFDYEPIEKEMIRLINENAVIEVAYDPYQLHDMCTRMNRKGVSFFRAFNQQNERLLADKALQDMIMGRTIYHDGNPTLRQHIDNANVKKTREGDNVKLRLVKRSSSQKIDAAVCLSMAAHRVMFYNLQD